MNVDTNYLMQAKGEIDAQIKKFTENKEMIDNLINVELKKVWMDTASEKLNNQYNNEGKEIIMEVENVLMKFSQELQNVAEEFNNVVNNVENSI